jgi:cytochrome c oxidase assembly protein subunit 15
MKTGNRKIGIWLLSGCFLIFCMVVIGGITRLTGSGLSITEWKPIMGSIPPLNNADWEIAFQKYKQIPQFQQVNYDFTLEDFKTIFFWEYFHRLIGRLIGIVFIVPFLWFFFKGMFDKKTLTKVLFLFFLGGLQGFLGWFMVKSGLSERTSVSHFRLAIHLFTAFLTFAFTLYFALELLKKKETSTYNKKLFNLIRVILVVASVQLVYGAFVAGMHAGKIYNTYPLMNGKFFPEGALAINPVWLNIFENQGTVQFIHRWLAALLVILTFALFFQTLKNKIKDSRKTGVLFLVIAIGIQFLLGVFTLLSGVNFTLAILHQAGAFFVFSAGVYLLFVFGRSNILGYK